MSPVPCEVTDLRARVAALSEALEWMVIERDHWRACALSPSGTAPSDRVPVAFVDDPQPAASGAAFAIARAIRVTSKQTIGLFAG